MTIPQIESREKEIEVPAASLSIALMQIREKGGWVPRMDCNGSKYVLHVIWPEVKQGDLL